MDSSFAKSNPGPAKKGPEVFDGPGGADDFRHASCGDSIAKNFFKVRDGIRYAGTHLIVDLWGCSGLDDLALVEQALRDSVAAAGATLLDIHLHHFTENDGVSGIAVLAESHISIHTWPEVGYAALDVFMCGAADPQSTIPVLKRAFVPRDVSVKDILRGQGL